MMTDTLKAIIAVGSGSFLGGMARYLVSLAMKNVNKGFPWATLLVNVTGCLLIGLLWGFVGYVLASVIVGIALCRLAIY